MIPPPKHLSARPCLLTKKVSRISKEPDPNYKVFNSIYPPPLSALLVITSITNNNFIQT